MGGVGEGEALAKSAGGDRELARVQRDGGDLGLGDANLDPAPGQPWVERVVVGVETQVGLRGNPGHLAAVDSGIGSGSGRIRWCSAASRSAGTARISR